MNLLYYIAQLNNSYSIILIDPIKMNVKELLDVDYNNIEDPNQLKKIINEFNLSLNIKVKEMQQLSHIRDLRIAEGKTVVNKMFAMQKENLSKTRQYEIKIENSKKSHEQKKMELGQQQDRILKSLQSKHLSAIGSMQQQISRLKQQYTRQGEMENEQFELLSEIKQKSLDLVNQQYEHHDNMNKLQNKQIEENRNLFLKNRQMIKELKKDIKIEAGRIVFQQKYENEDKNYQLKAKLFEVQDNVQKLRDQRNQLVKARNDTKINLSLNEDEVEQYKAVGSIQKSKIKMYNDKLQSLKKTIATQISKWQLKIKEKKSKWENELRASKLRLFNLEKEKQQLRLNLQKYKVLGETILMQRQEVQQFFLMSIETCKKQMDQSSGSTTNAEKQYGDKVDIDQLYPKDKHRIITNLYTKLALAPKK